MFAKFIKALRHLELEERILNGASVLALTGVFLPWLSGEWLGGDTVTHSGLHFYTALLGIFILLLHCLILGITIVPLAGGPPLVRRRMKDYVRLIASAEATILVIASLSVLMKVTFEFSRMEVRFGIYVTLVGSFIATIYSLLKVQEQRRQDAQSLFHHPEEHSEPVERNESVLPPPPPPPPPPPLEPEDHHLHA